MGPKIEELDDTLPDLEEDTSTADYPTVRPRLRRAHMEDLRNNLSSRSPPRIVAHLLHVPPIHPDRTPRTTPAAAVTSPAWT